MKDYQKIKQEIYKTQDMMMTAYDKGYADGIVQGRKERMQGEYDRGYAEGYKDGQRQEQINAENDSKL